MAVPFGDLGDAGVCARVAIALLKRKMKRVRLGTISAPILIGMVTADLHGMAFPTVRSCLLSLNAYCLGGGRSSAWLTSVLYRDMMGYTIRRCLHDDYKANRRDPRVTNRGVKPTTFQARSGETPRTTVLHQRDLLDIIDYFPPREYGDD